MTLPTETAPAADEPRPTLAELPHVYDVVLSDFGRVAALRLLNEVADYEREIVRTLIGYDRDFFDEYRRIMFTCVGDLAYVKSSAIRAYTEVNRPLDRNVLFGVGSTPIPAVAVEAITDVLVGPITEALGRGYDHVRVVIPCNTLGDIEDQLVRSLIARLPGIPVTQYGSDAITPATRERIVVYGVPRVVIRHQQLTWPDAHLMLIGTALARSTYRTVIDEMGARRIRLVECSPDEQDLMDRLVAASIDGDKGDLVALTEEMEAVVAYRRRSDRFSVIQASTDLDIGIGIQSLSVFARELVLDAYRPALPADLAAHS
jgi:hypothetical protein